MFRTRLGVSGSLYDGSSRDAWRSCREASFDAFESTCWFSLQGADSRCQRLRWRYCNRTLPRWPTFGQGYTASGADDRLVAAQILAKAYCSGCPSLLRDLDLAPCLRFRSTRSSTYERVRVQPPPRLVGSRAFFSETRVRSRLHAEYASIIITQRTTTPDTDTFQEPYGGIFFTYIEARSQRAKIVRARPVWTDNNLHLLPSPALDISAHRYGRFRSWLVPTIRW